MMSQPLISIIINNYNYERFLQQALESALAQTYPHREILVVDDGSTDGSRSLLERYADRVKLIFKENGGQASAFNRGFAESQGEVIMYLDSDDYWKPQLLERVASAWREGLSLLQWRLIGVDGEGRELGSLFPDPRRGVARGDIRRQLIRRGFYPHAPTSGLAFARSTLQQILPVDEARWRISADAPLYTCAPFYGEVEFIGEPLGYYRLHGSNNWNVQQHSVLRMIRVVDHELRKFAMINQMAQRCGLPPNPRLGLQDPYLVLRRLYFALLGVPELPWGQDSVAQLALAGIRASLTAPQVNYRARVRYIQACLACLLLPREGAMQQVLKRLFSDRSDAEREQILAEARESVRQLQAPQEVVG